MPRQAPSPAERGFGGRVRRLFLTGIVIILPLLITVWLLGLLFGLVHGVSTPFILKVLEWLRVPLVGDPAFETWIAPLIGIVATLAFIILVGSLTTNFLGRQFVAAFDRLMLRIPLIKAIYGASRQLLEALNRDRDSFQGVVMVEYPRKGVYTIGFVARAGTIVRRGRGRDALPGQTLVFLPTSPNPTSGWLAVVPDQEVIPLDMTIEDGLKTIVSGGLVLPEAWVGPGRIAGS